MPFKNFINRFFPSKKNNVQGTEAVTLKVIYRKRSMTEDQRRNYVTELLDCYYGFSTTYLAQYIRESISNSNIKREMLKIVRSLPLLNFFTNSVSRVYAVQPNRKFYLDGKEIIKTPKENKDNPAFDAELNKEKYHYDDKLYETLNDFYNDDVTTAIKQSERFTNLLNTCVYKVVTDDLGKIKIIFLPNDTVQINPSFADLSRAEQVAFIQDVINNIGGQGVLIPLAETWSKDQKNIPTYQHISDEDLQNYAAAEYEKLFGTKDAGAAFAPFAVFRDTGSATDFWDIKNYDIVNYIRSINMSLTELKYLEKFTSFGLKYTVNIKAPEDGVMDPNGLIQFAVANSAVPGADNGKNFEVGEFANAGSIDEVIKSIIMNLKILFSLYNIPLDSIVSTNSIKSAENKQLDNDALFDSINAQRDIWNKNEQNLFKIMQAVHNRDNIYKVPKGVSLLIDYSEQKTKEKTVDDWIVEIQQNVSTVVDWLSELNPDLDRDELFDLLKSNKSINDEQKKTVLDVNSFAAMDEDGNLIVPEDPNNKIDNNLNGNDNANN